MKIPCILMTCIALCQLATAESYRIDIAAREPQPIGLVVHDLDEYSTGSQANWLEDRKDQRLIFLGKATDTWEKREFSFLPKQQGEVDIVIMGDDWKTLPAIAYDHFTVNGKPLPNGSFETLKPGTANPTNWVVVGGTLKTDGGADGNNYVVTNHNLRFQQAIRVNRGQPVVVSFFCRRVPSQPQK